MKINRKDAWMYLPTKKDADKEGNVYLICHDGWDTRIQWREIKDHHKWKRTYV